MKKIISVILVCFMLLSAVTVCFAEDKMLSGYDYDFNSIFVEDFELTSEEVTEFAKRVLRSGRSHPYWFWEGSPMEMGLTEEDYQLWKNDYPAFVRSLGIANSDIFDFEVDKNLWGEYVISGFHLSLRSAENWALAEVYANAGYALPYEKQMYMAAKIHKAIERARPNGYYFPAMLHGESGEYFENDINFDCEVSLTDLKYLKAYLLGLHDIINIAAADRDGDGEITLKDYKKYKYYLMTN